MSTSPSAAPPCYNRATAGPRDGGCKEPPMTHPPTGNEPPAHEPAAPNRGQFRQIRISGGDWMLEILLTPEPGRPAGQAAIAELFDAQGALQLDQIAHISLHAADGTVHEIGDPALRASLLTRLHPQAAAPDLPTSPPNSHATPLNAFPGGQGAVPTNPAVFTTINAIWKGGDRARNLIDGWTSRDDGQPVYEHASVNGGRISVYVQPGRGRDLATADTLWALVEQLSPFTADVALAVLAQLCTPETGSRPQYPLLEPVRITADAILGYKGIQRWGAERADLRRRVATEIEHLRHLSFDVEGWPVGSGNQGREHASWRGDTLFDIVTVERGAEGQSASISWSVRAGQWAYWWLNASGRVFVGRMARALLELDHRENRGAALLAKKIGQHVLLRVGGTEQHRLILRVAALLADIGELPVEAARTKDWAGRTRDRLDDALLSLIESGLFADISWPDGYGPTDEDRQRGWVERWLAARVAITIATPQAPAELSPPPEDWRALVLPGLPPADEAPISGQVIRRARAGRQWKQEQLARHLGISVPYLSQLEGDRRQPSPQLAARLRAWMAEDAAGDP